jgi:hypothetical protein
MDRVTIDFEASCLPRHGRSYPIELGLAGPGVTHAWLIRPHAAWQGWDWTQEAFAVHGITREQLADEGLPADVVLARALDVIGTARVIADSRLDRLWWQILCEAVEGGHSGHGLRIDTVAMLLDDIEATHEQVIAAQRHADFLCPQRHRAGPDAQWLWALICALPERRHADAFWPCENGGASAGEPGLEGAVL